MQKNKDREFTEIALSLYGDECEMSEYKRGTGMTLLFLFDRSVNGYITIDNLVTTVRDGRSRFDARLLARGDYDPKLIADGRMISLPRLRKNDKGVFPEPPGEDYIRAVSIRERELEAKVRSLEKTVLELHDSVFGKTIF